MAAMIKVDKSFYSLVVKMRRAQRAYFNPSNFHRKQSLLEQAKSYERQVDQWIEQIDKEIAIEEAASQLSFSGAHPIEKKQ